MDYSLPGSSVYRILQARILEWVAYPFSKGSSQHRDQTQVSRITGFFSSQVTREANFVLEYSQFGEGNGTQLQHSCLENLMDGGAWWAAVHGVAKSRTRLRDFPFTFHFPASDKEMATHSSVLAWRIPGAVEPGGLLSMGSHKSRTQLKQLSSNSSSIAN